MLCLLGGLLLLDALALSMLLGRDGRNAFAGEHALFAVVVIAAVAALAERGRVKIVGSIEASISLVPIIFGAVLFGPVAAMLVGAASFLAELGGSKLKWAIYTCLRSLVGAAAGLAALAAGLGSARSLGALAAAAIAAAVAAGVADLLLASLIHVLRRIGSMADLVRNAAPPLLLSIPLYTPLVTGLAFIYQRSSPFVLLLFFIPALAAQRLFVLFQNERRLNREVTSHVDQLESAHSSFVDALVVTLDARDRYTAGHSHAVAVYARDIAHALGLPAEEQALAYRCGLVHDIGKIGVAPGLLEKPGALTLNERREVERHPVVGEEILARIDGNQQLAAIVRHHHERLDGQGYPDGLRGEQIPLLSRVLAVADTYNAMTSERPYREAMPSRVARLRLQQAAGSQLDVEALVAFERLLATRGEDYRTAQGREFVRENTPKPVEFNPADELPYQLLAAAG